MRRVMICIRKRHLNNIRKGCKRYELRRTRPRAAPPFEVLCCVSGTGGDVEAGFVVDRIALLTQAPEARIAALGCITPEEARAWRGEAGELYGWHIAEGSLCDFKALGRVPHISDYGVRRPPQGWQYIDE